MITVDGKSEIIFSEPSVMAETSLHFCIYQRVDRNCQTGRFVFKLFSIINSMRRYIKRWSDLIHHVIHYEVKIGFETSDFWPDLWPYRFGREWKHLLLGIRSKLVQVASHLERCTQDTDANKNIALQMELM